MSEVKLPLSGNVNQVINPWTFSPLWSVGPVTINMGDSSKPEAETQILAEVGSYGRQLGRIGDVLAVLLRRFSDNGIRAEPLTEEERKAIAAFKKMTDDIAGVKGKHDAAPALRFDMP